MDEKLVDITQYVGDDRNKRSIFAIGAAIVSTFIKGALFFLQRKRELVMREDIKRIRDKTYILEETVGHLDENLIMLARVTNEHFNMVGSNISTIRNEIGSLRSHVRIMNNDFMRLNTTVNWLRIFAVNNRLLARTNAKSIDTLNRVTEYIDTTENTLNRMLTGFQDLEMRKFPESLISRANLAQAIQGMRQNIHDKFPGQTLLISNPKDIYLQNDVSYSIENNIIIIQVPLFLKETHSRIMTLFKIHTTFVQFNTQDSQQNEQIATYTKLKMSHKYYATNDEYYFNSSKRRRPKGMYSLS